MSSWLDFAVSALAIVGAAGPLVAALKELTGEPTHDDSQARVIWFRVLSVLDYVASNSTPISAKLAAMRSERMLRAAYSLPVAPSSQPPPAFASELEQAAAGEEDDAREVGPQ